MAIEVRPIEAAELPAWVDTLHLGFHVQRPIQAEADFLRDVLGQDMARTLGAVDEQRVVGTLYSFPAQLTLPGNTTVVADAIAAVTVRPTHRRRGLLRRLIDLDLRAARDRGEAASILIAAEYPIYGRFGFGPATEQVQWLVQRHAATFTRTARGSVDLLEPQAMLEQAPGIFDRFRRLRPGQIDRPASAWPTRLGLLEAPWLGDTKPPRAALYVNPAGEPQGYLLYRVSGSSEAHLPNGTLDVSELIALTPDAYLGLWQYACGIDLVAKLKAGMRCSDEPLGWLLANARAALQQTLRTDLLWLRPLDIPATLGTRRYLAEGRIVLEVSDPLGLCGGRFVVEGGPQGSTCRSTTDSADLSMDTTALGSIVLGGTTLQQLHAAQAIDELRPGAVQAGDRLFDWPVAPWCSTFF